jgi:hypothetical protein
MPPVVSQLVAGGPYLRAEPRHRPRDLLANKPRERRADGTSEITQCRHRTLRVRDKKPRHEVSDSSRFTTRHETPLKVDEVLSG